MSRSVRDNPIPHPYPAAPATTLAEAESRIAASMAAIANAGDGTKQVGSVCAAVSAIDIALLDEKGVCA